MAGQRGPATQCSALSPRCCHPSTTCMPLRPAGQTNRVKSPTPGCQSGEVHVLPAQPQAFSPHKERFICAGLRRRDQGCATSWSMCLQGCPAKGQSAILMCTVCRGVVSWDSFSGELVCARYKPSHHATHFPLCRGVVGRGAGAKPLTCSAQKQGRTAHEAPGSSPRRGHRHPRPAHRRHPVRHKQTPPAALQT